MKNLSNIFNAVFVLSLFVAVMTQAQTIPLDGDWQFTTDSTARLAIGDVMKRKEGEGPWRAIRVPGSWQAQFADLRDYQGVAWYMKELDFPKTAPKRTTAMLHFGAIDYRADVFVNGKPAGSHEGGYTPFDIEITPLIHPGKNTLAIRVLDPTGKGTEGIGYKNIPHGKQSWYVQTSGLWQSAEVQFKPERYVQHAIITASLDGAVTADIRMGTSFSEAMKSSIHALSLRYIVIGPDGGMKTSGTGAVQSNASNLTIHFRIDRPSLWSFEHPNLYTLVLSLDNGDTVQERFGFRTIEAKGGKLYLNGEPFFLIGALDQDFYPESIYTTPSEEYLRDEMRKAKRIGLNMLRCHIKVPDPRYLKVADEEGVLVWYEIPNWDEFTPEVGKRAMETFDAMLDRDWNHPSLVILSLINESWGLDLQKPEQRAWLKEAFNAAKKKAARRLVVDNSACWGNFHVKTDINDYHTYWSIPENKDRFDQTLADMAKRPDWLFSKFGDAEETKREPLLLSEFGNWGLPDYPKPYPWWISRRFGDAEVALPEGFDQRFTEFGYDKTYGTFHALSEECQRAQFDALKYEIEQIRLTPGLQGYIVTEFTDINWESNGLLDMWRNVKVYGDELAKIQQQDVIIPRPVKYNYYNGEDSPEIRLSVAHYSKHDLTGAVLSWHVDGESDGHLTLERAERGSIIKLPAAQISRPFVSSPRKCIIAFTLKTKEGTPIAENTCDIFLYPFLFSEYTHHQPDPAGDLDLVEMPENLSTIRLFAQGGQMKNFDSSLHRMGLNTDSLSSNLSHLLVTNSLAGDIIERIRNGEKALLLVDSTTKAPENFPVTITSKDAPWYDGNWASNFNWIRRDQPPFDSLNFGGHFGFEAARVMPHYVLTGIPPERFIDSRAGMFIGWLHLNSAFLFPMQVGKGTLVLCTFRLPENMDDPYAQRLFKELVTYTLNVHPMTEMGWK